MGLLDQGIGGFALALFLATAWTAGVTVFVLSLAAISSLTGRLIRTIEETR